MSVNEKIPQHESKRRQPEGRCATLLPLQTAVVISVIIAAVIIASQSVHAASTASKTVVVTMTDKPPTYVPARLTVKVGTTILWKNTGATLRDVTTDPSVAQNKGDVEVPPGAKPFDSGFMPPGASWSYTLTIPGRYVYACIPHEKDRMIGEITVTK